MDWPSAASGCDVVVVRDETPAGPRFVVHSSRGPQFACRTYAEAEAQALSYAERTHAHAWYTDGRGLQLVGSFVRVASSPTIAQLNVTPAQAQKG